MNARQARHFQFRLNCAVKLMQRIRKSLREAQTLSFADAYLPIGCCCVAETLIVPLMRKVAPPKKPSIDAH